MAETVGEQTSGEQTHGPPPPLAGYTGYLLGRAFVRDQACTAAAMPPGRHPRDLGVLAVLQAAGQPSQRRLGELLGINRTLMVTVADGLEADGLLTRERDPANRRSYALAITAAGRTALAEMTRGARECEAELTAALPDARRRRLVELLRQIVPGDIEPEELAGLSAFFIPRAHHLVGTEAAAALAKLGIAPRHSTMLITLAAIEPCAQQRLAAALGVSGPAVVGTVDELQDRGLIVRQRNDRDRREQLLRLTAAGRDVLDTAVAALDQVHEQLASRIGAAEMAELNDLLIKIIE
ncbi:MAG: MarR family winged helix-turn-helix transcriptional regulator [Streptosporangiaceae bacterium]